MWRGNKKSWRKKFKSLEAFSHFISIYPLRENLPHDRNRLGTTIPTNIENFAILNFAKIVLHFWTKILTCIDIVY